MVYFIGIYNIYVRDDPASMEPAAGDRSPKEHQVIPHLELYKEKVMHVDEEVHFILY